MRLFYPNKENFSCERGGTWRTMSETSLPTGQRRASSRHQFSEGTPLNSMSLSQLDTRENFPTRTATPLHQAGVCVISFQVWCFQTSWTWYRPWDKLRPTQLAAMTVNEVCAVMRHKDSLHHSLQPGELSFPQGFSTWAWASYLFRCFSSMRLRRKIFCCLHFFTGAKDLSI